MLKDPKPLMSPGSALRIHPYVSVRCVYISASTNKCNNRDHYLVDYYIEKYNYLPLTVKRSQSVQYTFSAITPTSTLTRVVVNARTPFNIEKYNYLPLMVERSQSAFCLELVPTLISFQNFITCNADRQTDKTILNYFSSRSTSIDKYGRKAINFLKYGLFCWISYNFHINS